MDPRLPEVSMTHAVPLQNNFNNLLPVFVKRGCQMTNRREFLQAATMLSAAPLVGRVAFAEAQEPMAVDAVLFDSRHQEAQDFGARASRLGARVREIKGDITDVWQQVLLQHWQSEPAAVMGLTERPALFLLERLAWDHGLRVLFEAEHVRATPVLTEHRITSAENPSLQHMLVSAGRNWPSILAENLIEGVLHASGQIHPTQSGMASHLDEPVTLYSWIIAPRTAV